MSDTDLSFPEPPAPPAPPWRLVGSEYVGLTAGTLAAHKAAWQTYQLDFRAWRDRCDAIGTAAAEALMSRGFPATVRAWTHRGNHGREGGRRLRGLVNVLAECAPTAELKSLWTGQEEEWLRRAGERARQQRLAAEETALRDRAVTWLLARGLTYGPDFKAETAAEVALDVACQEKISERVKPGVFHAFAGDDDCEGCRGWDGKSERCDCGGQRVYWVYEGTFEEPLVYGKAN